MVCIDAIDDPQFSTPFYITLDHKNSLWQNISESSFGERGKFVCVCEGEKGWGDGKRMRGKKKREPCR